MSERVHASRERLPAGDVACAGQAVHVDAPADPCAWLVFETLVSLNLRLKDLLGPVTRVKKKFECRSDLPVSVKLGSPLRNFSGPFVLEFRRLSADGPGRRTYSCITQLKAEGPSRT